MYGKVHCIRFGDIVYAHKLHPEQFLKNGMSHKFCINLLKNESSQMKMKCVMQAEKILIEISLMVRQCTESSIFYNESLYFSFD